MTEFQKVMLLKDYKVYFLESKAVSCEAKNLCTSTYIGAMLLPMHLSQLFSNKAYFKVCFKV